MDKYLGRRLVDAPSELRGLILQTVKGDVQYLVGHYPLVERLYPTEYRVTQLRCLKVQDFDRNARNTRVHRKVRQNARRAFDSQPGPHYGSLSFQTGKHSAKFVSSVLARRG
jgi:hypothetical protein